VSVDVVIVGAGPTGVTAAILLAQQGVAVTVLDRFAEVFPQPRAVHLDDEVYRILELVGVADEFARVSRPAAGLRLVDRQQRVLAEIGRAGVAASSGFPRANMFDQPELERILRERMLRLPEVTFRGGVDVTAVTAATDGGATIVFTDIATGREDRVTARYVLGCDGAKSIVRRAIGSDYEDLGFEQRWLVIDINTDASLRQWEGVHQVCDSRRAATYMRVGDRRYRWEFQLLENETAADFTTIADVSTLVAPWTGATALSQLELIRVAEYTFRAMVADRWQKDGIFLLGDAAHLTPPFIGQGMGAGLRDAMNLSWKLSGVIHHQMDASVLETYEVERKPHARAAIGLAKLTGTLMTAGGRMGDQVRGLVAPWVMRLPRISSRIADSETPPLPRSSWVLRRRGDRLAGRLCPRTFDESGNRVPAPQRFTVVTAVMPTSAQCRDLGARGCQIARAMPGSALAEWLRAGRASAALVRPDGTALRSDRNPTAVVDEAMARLNTLAVAAR